MGNKQVSEGKEVDQRLAALITNANAVQAVAAAVEGTIGPKGLDTMLVDRFGAVTITNDGVTILEEMEATHPAARMVINTARAQENEVGDGTTTATILAASLVSEGLSRVMKGVPVARLLDGIQLGLERALDFLRKRARPVRGCDDPILYQVAHVAGRGRRDIAELIVQAAAMVGEEKLRDPAFKLRDSIVAVEGAANQVFEGVLVRRSRLHKMMPTELHDVRVLIVDDALAPEELGEGSLATEAGFNKYLSLQEEFYRNLIKIIDLGVRLVVVDRGVDDRAEEILAEAGVMVLKRVSTKEWRRVAEHTGAWPIKRTGLKKGPEELLRCLGRARRVWEDERLEHVRVEGGEGKPYATILVGAATAEVLQERERIARDAASAVQAALRGGVVPGGGTVELAVARDLEPVRSEARGMAAYGVECVMAALERPFMQIVTNAGFNALEKLGEAVAAQRETGKDSIGVDCDTGAVCDLWEKGIVDPMLVKFNALQAAGELAQAILRIDTIVRRKEGEKGPDSARRDEF
ncbi:MAG: TCP-1/cpn60 chaperonin family protein [Thermacetogeniaceae bacterium]